MKKTKAKVRSSGSFVELLKYPVAILLVLSLFRLISLSLFSNIFDGIFVILILLVYGYIGWSAVKRYSFSLGKSAWAGIIAVGITSFVFLILLMFSGKTVFDMAGVNPMELGIPPEAIERTKMIMTISSFIFSVIIGGIVALIGAVVAQRIK
jgi:hypothetical protein